MSEGRSERLCAYFIVQLHISYLHKPRPYLRIDLLNIKLSGLEKVSQCLPEHEGNETLLDTRGKGKIDRR